MNIFDVILPGFEVLTNKYAELKEEDKNPKETNEDWTDLDLSKKEDHDKAVKYLNDIKENSVVSLLLGDDYIDDVIAKVDKVYNDANPLNQLEIVEEEDLPSSRISEGAHARIAFLADKYIEDQYGDVLDKEDEKELRDELIEFGAWMLNYKD